MTLVPLFARQAIYNEKSEVVAYELLFRHSDGNYAEFIDGDKASSQVILNSFGGHELEELIGGKKAFVNFTRNLILNPPPISPKHLVIEILEDIKADQELIQGLERLKAKGYTIALDDFFITRDTKKMMSYASIIKVDVLALTNTQLVKYVSKLKPLKFTLLAEKVETHEMYQHCVDLGFDFFQGYYLCKPQIIKGRKVSESKQNTLKLISILNDQDAEFETVVDTIATDPGLSYKILRLVNSSAMGMPVEISSLSQAVSMLGLSAIKNWANFLLMANCGEKPPELSIISMCRAKFCSELGAKLGDKALADSCYTVGLLSNLDAFLDMPMSDLLTKLNLSKELSSALSNFAGQAGLAFDVVNKYERGQWDAIPWDDLSTHGIDAQTCNTLYADAITWATEMSYS
ncbi:MAG: EAL and modified HD-GYP domain-containing signal transduction protein [Flavobacteriales bacterium]|jgi:EAL and modified HD-GYP domain-containing signal transduction protein